MRVNVTYLNKDRITMKTLCFAAVLTAVLSLSAFAATTNVASSCDYRPLVCLVNEKSPDGLVATFASGEKSTLVKIPGLKEAIEAIPPEKRSLEYYLKYRVRRFEGVSAKGFDGVSFIRFVAPRIVSLYLPLKQTGEVETVRLRPLFMSMRKSKQFDPAQLSDVQIGLSGTGEIEFHEFGEIANLPDPEPNDAGLPHVDSEAFALFPEPRIFRDTGKTVPLAVFGPTFRVSGDITSGPIDWFRREMKDFYGLDFAESADAKIVFEVADATDIPDYDRIQFDGFAIDVSANRIRVAAKDPKGIVYGVHALCDMVKMATGDVGVPRVRLVQVVDWPRFGTRVFQDMIRCCKHAQKLDPRLYAEMLERFGIASRFNMLSMELGVYYRWSNLPPEVAIHEKAWTRDELDYVIARMNANAMCVYPWMNGLGHVKAFPLGSAAAAKRFGEDGNCEVLCNRNPETMALLFGTFAEYLDACSANPRFKPKYVYAGMDECRWQTDKVPPEERCRLCAGRAKNEVFLDQVTKINDWCRSCGVRMLMADDMIRAYHNGLNRFRCHEIEPRIPKDVIYGNWSSHDFIEIAETTAAGHENWKVLTGYKDDSLNDEYVSAYGLTCCVYNWWLTETRRPNGPYGLMAQRILADQMWRRPARRSVGDGGTPTERIGDGLALVRRWGDFLLRNWSRKPIPSGTTRFESIDLSCFGKIALDAELDVMAKDIGGIPVRIETKGGRVAAVEATAEGVRIPVGRRAASIAFLQASTAGMSTFDRTNYADELKGPLTASYEVEYEDGAREEVEIRFGWNALEWLSPSTTFDTFQRYPADSRAIWTGKLTPAAREAGKRIKWKQLFEPDTAVANLWEWVNPHPEKKIAAFVLKRRSTDVRYALIALTLRGVASASNK